jgi:glycosyltransferase involved in cell wall biosynthesis
MKNVMFLKNISPGTSEHLQILRSHDVFVFPSRREAFGYAALEALNFGQVVVTTRQAGIAPLIEEAGGLIGNTPEETVQLAFTLLQDRRNLYERRERIRRFMVDYPARFGASLKEMLNV